ncbi:MAG: hypothetical protein SZ59_C0002G0371 [candidate division TM6 bacterium GW2011_GWF2_28_16]|nr:MAG: hypothetical protein SZ59_C0002G0371 [candidate division TM6 bacterium GW2011_GWF2_28_16]
MINSPILTTIITWVVNIFFSIAVVPQVYLNYKNKSVRGLSDLYIVGYFNGYAFNVLYIYALGFPVAYKIRAIIAFFVISILIYQRFLYNNSVLNNKTKKLYLGNFCFLLFIAFLIYLNPIKFGNFAGWALVIIWSIYQLPQLLKVYKSKSVEGFSFFLISFVGIGNLIEFWAAYLLNLPLQTSVTALRGVFVYLIFVSQFWAYKYKFELKTPIISEK